MTIATPLPATLPRGDTASALPTRWAAVDGAMSTGRFCLYVSYACPWSHRVLIAIALNGLEHLVEIVDVEPEMDDIGWQLDGGHLADIYRRYAPSYTGNATVPLMVEVATGQIVGNESADLMRMFGTLIPGSGNRLFPTEHAAACDAWNDDLQIHVNKRVYEFGFAATDDQKSAKTQALMEKFLSIDRHLARCRFLVTDDRPIEPDWRLWVTLARYEQVYRPFLLGADAIPLGFLPNLKRFLVELRGVPGVSLTYRQEEITAHYLARLRDLPHEQL